MIAAASTLMPSFVLIRTFMRLLTDEKSSPLTEAEMMKIAAPIRTVPLFELRTSENRTLFM